MINRYNFLMNLKILFKDIHINVVSWYMCILQIAKMVNNNFPVIE